MVSFIKKILRKYTTPKRPCTDDEFAWIESSFLWLEHQFGPQPLMRPILAPTREYFPTKWHGTQEDCDELIERMCEFMQIDRDEIEVSYYQAKLDRSVVDTLPIFEGDGKAVAAGLYSPDAETNKHFIGIAQDYYADPVSLVATICHELGHVHLLGHGRLSKNYHDHESLTDILTIYYGAGIFTANSAFQFRQWQDGGRYGWRGNKQGYLSEPILGYAMACYAWMRGESDPPWQVYLATNIRYYFDDSIYYLKKTGHTKLPFGPRE